MTAPIVKTYPRGALVRISVAFTANDDDITPTDPTTVTAKTFTPDLIEAAFVFGTDAEVINADPVDPLADIVGKYYMDVNANEAGTWHYRWEGTGTAQAVAERTFKVSPSVFA